MRHTPLFKLIVLVVGMSGMLAASGTRAAEPLPAVSFPPLANLYARMAGGQRIKIAFLGGSITWGACATDPMKTSYRALVSAELESQFPMAHLKFIDAAIGGQPSKLAVFRMDRDVTPYQPDLVFVEFAVNDYDTPDSQETMEGIVRKLHRDCPNAAVVILVIGSNWDYHTPAEAKHIELAKYYGVPCIDICAAVQERIRHGLNTHDILSDGCHPNDVGYRLYADIINSQLAAMLTQPASATPFPAKPLTPNHYETAAMLELSKLKDLGDWTKDQPSVVGTWFDQQPSRWQSSMIAAHRDGDELAVDLRCSALGVYFESAQGAGTVEIKADDQVVQQTSLDMALPFARVNFGVTVLNGEKERHVQLVATHIAKGVKVAYLLYCQ